MAQKSDINNSFLSMDIIKIYEPYFIIFPDYYKSFSNLLNAVIYKENDSSMFWKYKLFFGIMASSTLGCEFLLEDFKEIFKSLGGDKSWIDEGIKCKNMPEHIKGMAIINNILAHKPWVLDWRHFTEFKNGLSTFLFQSAIILTTIQRFSTIISTLNLIINKDEKNINKNENLDKNNNKKEENKTVDKINQENKFKIGQNEKNKKENGQITINQKNEIIEQRKKNIITLVNNNYAKIREIEENKGNILINNNSFKKYISDLIISYTDFNPHMEKYLYEEDFSWKRNAQYFYFDYAGKEMEYLDKEMKDLENLNSENTNLDNQKIDIFNLREVIEKYLKLIYGIKDDEYNYHLTNELIPVELKRIIKKISLGPEQIKEQELISCLEILNIKEFIYLIFIVTSIKQKISLIFFARAYDEFTSNNKLMDNK